MTAFPWLFLVFLLARRSPVIASYPTCLDLPFEEYPSLLSSSFPGSGCPWVTQCPQRAVGNSTSGILSPRCNCDNQCSFFGDCCSRSSGQRLPEAFPGQMCVNPSPTKFGQSAWYMLTRCSSRWPNDDTRQRCENSSIIASDLRESLKLQLPVSSPFYTYANIYCAKCNYHEEIRVTYWEPAFFCEGEKFGYISPSKANTACTTPAISKLNCSLATIQPSLSEGAFLRRCIQSISTCLSLSELSSKLDYPLTTSNYTCLRDRCLSYTDYVWSTSGTYFRNRHCAFCNGISLSSLFCYEEPKLAFGPTVRFDDLLYYLNNTSADSRLDSLTFLPIFCVSPPVLLPPSLLFNQDKPFTEIDVNELKYCSYGYVYDPQRLTCVPVRCRTGHVLSDGYRCRRAFAVYLLTFITNATLRDEYSNNVSVEIRELLENYSPNTTNVEISSLYIIEMEVFVLANFSSSSFTDLEWNELNSSLSVLNVTFVYKGIMFTTRNSTFATLISDNNQLRCPQIEYNSNEYNVSSDGLVTLLSSGKSFNRSQYTLSKNKSSVFVCSTFRREFNETTTIKVWDYSQPYAIFSASVSIATAIVCFVLFVTYVGFKDLRTYPGLCIAGYALSLGFSFTFMVIGLGWVENKAACTSMGFLLHFFQLSHFAWSSVIAIDLVKTFVTVDMRNVEEIRKTALKRFAKASLFAWGISAVVCVVCLALQYVATVNITYSSDRLCWIQPDLAVLVAFGIPVAVVLVFNFSCFVVLSFVVRKQLKQAARLTELVAKASALEKIQKQIRIFLGTFALLGLTFILAYVAVLTDEEWLWYCFTVANLFQAVTLLVVFELNRKVRKLFGKALRLTKHRDYQTSNLYSRKKLNETAITAL